MKRSAILLASALAMSVPAYAQDVRSDRNAQAVEHGQMERDITAQKMQAARVREDTRALQEERARCRTETGPARADCMRQIQTAKAQKQSDVAAFQQDKAVHQADSVKLEAMHRKPAPTKTRWRTEPIQQANSKG